MNSKQWIMKAAIELYICWSLPVSSNRKGSSLCIITSGQQLTPSVIQRHVSMTENITQSPSSAWALTQRSSSIEPYLSLNIPQVTSFNIISCVCCVKKLLLSLRGAVIMANLHNSDDAKLSGYQWFSHDAGVYTWAVMFKSLLMVCWKWA